MGACTCVLIACTSRKLFGSKYHILNIFPFLQHAVNMMNLQQDLHRQAGNTTPLKICTPHERFGGDGRQYGIHGRYCRFYDKFLELWTKADGTNSITKTPKGLRYPAWSTTGNLGYSATAAMVIVLESKYNATDRAKVKLPLAQSQAKYILGSTGFSYLIGFGGMPQMAYPKVKTYPFTYMPGSVSLWPRFARHASSSCPTTGKCDTSTYASSSPNRQLLKGGLVGGPGGKRINPSFPDASYFDYRSKATNLVTVEYTCGLTTLLAGLCTLL
jgi:endoglucanase